MQAQDWVSPCYREELERNIGFHWLWMVLPLARERGRSNLQLPYPLCYWDSQNWSLCESFYFTWSDWECPAQRQAMASRTALYHQHLLPSCQPRSMDWATIVYPWEIWSFLQVLLDSFGQKAPPYEFWSIPRREEGLSGEDFRWEHWKVRPCNHNVSGWIWVCPSWRQRRQAHEYILEFRASYQDESFCAFNLISKTVTSTVYSKNTIFRSVVLII